MTEAEAGQTPQRHNSEDKQNDDNIKRVSDIQKNK